MSRSERKTNSFRLQSPPTSNGYPLFKAALEKVKADLGKLPKTIIADAGYGSEENYAYLEREQIQAVVKYSTYHKEKSKKWKKRDRKDRKLEYDEEQDTWTCQQDRNCIFATKAKRERKVDMRFESVITEASCEGCPLKPLHKAKGNREVRVSMK